ncbi:MAG: hypothetical protein HY560_03690 [Gemmatimonadetes bacterium]|nr:hypothetical protein [Gemmatimonadota bacterium]
MALRRGHGGMAVWRRCGVAWMPLAAILALSTAPVPAAGQSPAPRTGRPWFASVSHYGRWLGLAGSAGLFTTSGLRYRDADHRRDEIAELCGTTSCGETSDGRYLDQQAESLRLESERLERQAKLWLLGGEVTLLATGTMFLLDLIYGDKGPPNIPYSPFSVYAAPGVIGLQLRFSSTIRRQPWW